MANGSKEESGVTVLMRSRTYGEPFQVIRLTRGSSIFISVRLTASFFSISVTGTPLTVSASAAEMLGRESIPAPPRSAPGLRPRPGPDAAVEYKKVRLGRVVHKLEIRQFQSGADGPVRPGVIDADAIAGVCRGNGGE